MSEGHPGSTPGFDPDAGVSAPLLSGFSTRDGGGGVRPSAEFAVPEDHRYRAPQLLGIGGMGRVVAVHDRRLRRDVALKVPNPDTPLAAGLDARLAREARITARLDHPGILPILDAGIGLDGRSYYTMPIVRGRSLADVLRHAAEPDARLRYLRRVLEACEAVGWAHRQGIVHCDLKPANVMIGEGGGVRVLDWGLARTLDEEAPTPPIGDASPRTSGATAARRSVVGTPQYMSPEQAGGATPDPRSDVWSLGAILFEVCAGRPLRAPGSASDVISRAREEATRGMPTLAFDNDLSPELAAVVTRALAARPGDRYSDAQAMADDLGNFLDGRRVTAHVYTRWDLLARFLKAWRAPVVVALGALLVVATLVAVGMQRLSDEAERSAAAAAHARAAEDRTRVALADASEDLARSLLSQALLQSEKGARPEAELLAAGALVHRESPLARGVLATWGAAEMPSLTATMPLPRCLDVFVARDGRLLLCREESALSAWDLGPDGMQLRWRERLTVRVMSASEGLVAVMASDLDMRVLDAATGALREQYISPCESRVGVHGGRLVASNNGCYYSVRLDEQRPDLRFPCAGHGLMGAFTVHDEGEEWAALCEDGTLVQGEFAGDRPWRPTPTRLAGAHIALAAAFTSEGRLVAGTALGDLVTIDTRSGAELGSVPSGFPKIVDLAVAPDPRLLLATSSDGAMSLYEPAEGLVRARLPAFRARFAAFVGEDVVIADEQLRRYRVPRGSPHAFDLGSGVTAVAFDPGGETIAASSGYRVDARRVPDGALVRRLEPEFGFVKSVTFSNDGLGFYVSNSARDPVRLWRSQQWETTTWQEVARPELGHHARRIVGVKGGALLAMQYRGGVGAFFPPDAQQHELVAVTQRYSDLSASADGSFAVALGERDGDLVRITAPALVAETIGHDMRARAAAIGNGGAIIATVGDGGANLWDADSGALVLTYETPGVLFTEVAIAPDMRWIAAGARDGSVWLWELGDGRLAAKMVAHRDRVSSLAFSPDSQRLASGSWDGSVRLFDLERMGTPGAELVGELEAAWGRDLQDVLDRDESAAR